MCFIEAAAIGTASAGTTASAGASAAAMATMANAAITSAILGAVSAGVSFYGQQQQAKYQEDAAKYQYQVQIANRSAQESAQKRQFEVTSKEATDAAKMAYLLNAKKQQEFEAQAASEIYAVSQQSQRAAGSARVASSEMGVTGSSIDALLKDFSRQELNYQTSVLREQQNRAYMAQTERQMIRDQQYARILGAQPQPLPIIGSPVLPPRPTFLAAGLEMGSSIANLYANPYFARSLALT